MNRIGIIVLGSLLYLSIGEAAGQQPSRVGVRVELQGRLPTHCVPAGETVETVQMELGTALVRNLVESGYWAKFCWKIEPYDDQNRPHGVIKITLKEVPADLAEISVAVSAGPTVQFAVPLIKFNLLNGHGTRYPRGELLRDYLIARFTESCLESSAEEEKLHLLLRTKIPMGTGMVKHNFPVAANDPYGLILLPWDEFGIFGEARFKFRYPLATGIEWLHSKGTGLPDAVTLSAGGTPICCLLTKHERAPVMPPMGPVEVFLDMSSQEILLLQPPAVPSCSSAGSETSIPVFE
jgi:hypothetical protein